MASSPLRAPAAAAGQQQSRLMDMQKKFQQRHLAAVAAMNNATKSMTLSNNTTDLPASPVKRLGGVGIGQQHQQQRQISNGVGSVTSGNGSDSVVQVDVKGKRQSGGKINTKTATIPKKPTTTAVANGYGAGRGLKNTVAGGTKPAGNKPAGATNHTNRLLLPPVVQPTVINALAAGAGAAAAVASVSAATAAGAQKPLVRAAKLPPTNHGSLQKPTAAPRRAAAAQPSKVTAPASRRPIPKRSVPAPTTARSRPQSVKPQLSMDRGPPAPGMARCSLCARDFKTERLPKHEEVCRKRNRKRKVFDASRQRLEAVAAETGMDVNSLKKMSQKTDQQVAEKLRKKKDAWRRQHDQLVRNVRAARAVQRHLAAGGSIRDLPPELENEATNQDDEVDSDLVKCPHCGRTFNDAAAERHVPLCAERQRNAAARAQNKRR